MRNEEIQTMQNNYSDALELCFLRTEKYKNLVLMYIHRGKGRQNISILG